MATTRIPAAEVERNLRAWIARARSGEEIVIEEEGAPDVLLRAAPGRPVCRLSESLRLARAHGVAATLDPAFAADLEAAIQSHPEPLESPWD